MAFIGTIHNLDGFIKRYIAGETEQKLAGEIGISRTALRTRLISNGVKIRGCSEANTIRMSHLSRKQRLKITSAAHTAVRGFKQSDEHRTKISKTLENNGAYGSGAERKLAEILCSKGINTIPQKSIYKYNVDLAFQEYPIAVEIFGGMFHSFGRHKARHFRRVKDILDSGWHIVIIWINGFDYPLGIGSADYLIRFCDELRLNPSLPRQYRVIFGNGDICPIRKSYLNDRPII